MTQLAQDVILINSNIMITKQNILQNQMALNLHIAGQGRPCGLMKVVCWVYILAISVFLQYINLQTRSVLCLIVYST
jgi:hypothetical protein